MSSGGRSTRSKARLSENCSKNESPKNKRRSLQRSAKKVDETVTKVLTDLTNNRNKGKAKIKKSSTNNDTEMETKAAGRELDTETAPGNKRAPGIRKSDKLAVSSSPLKSRARKHLAAGRLSGNRRIVNKKSADVAVSTEESPQVAPEIEKLCANNDTEMETEAAGSELDTETAPASKRAPGIRKSDKLAVSSSPLKSRARKPLATERPSGNRRIANKKSADNAVSSKVSPQVAPAIEKANAVSDEPTEDDSGVTEESGKKMPTNKGTSPRKSNRNSEKVSRKRSSTGKLNTTTKIVSNVKTRKQGPLDKWLNTPSSKNSVTGKKSEVANSVGKKLPVWKQPDQKRANCSFEGDGDVYDFVPEWNEPKRAKKKRVRKRVSSAEYKPSRKVKIPPAKNRNVSETVAVINDAAQPKPPSPEVCEPTREENLSDISNGDVNDYVESCGNFQEDDNEEPVVNSDKCSHKENFPNLPSFNNSKEMENQEIVIGHEKKSEIVEPQASIFSDWDAEEVPTEEETPAVYRDFSSSAAVASGSPRPPNSTIPSKRSTLAIDNCFGFDTSMPENSIVCGSFVESTPLKACDPNGKKQLPGAQFSQVSPVKKVFREPLAVLRNKVVPARLPEQISNVAAKIVKVNQTKTTSLSDFVKETVSVDAHHCEMDDNSENRPPPTPPSVFTQPARRSYSKEQLRAAKRQMFQDHEDEENEEEDHQEVETEARKKPRHKNTYSKTVCRKKTKKDAELEQWAKLMSSHFDDVEKFHLSFD